MKKLISLFAILAMVFSMQSCINSGDTPDATQTIALKGYNHIHEPAKTDAPLRNKAAKYEMDINLSQMTMTLKATGAIESDGEEISLVFNNIALKYDQTNGGFTFSLPEATRSLRSKQLNSIVDGHRHHSVADQLYGQRQIRHFRHASDIDKRDTGNLLHQLFYNDIG